ncbi:MAG: transketolase C-terminal domain-containing protein, partial [Planktomarina sp.]|nr:transketolase C-terminal domain-containing protein [Planktomarina sp.]
VALGQKNTPTVMALSRQNVPPVRKEYKSANLSARGAYVLAEATGKRQAILMATGTEVSLAMEAKALLEAEGIGTRVVSMPCMELFAQQSDAYRKRILPSGAVRVAVEAAVRMGWDHWLLGERGREAKAAFVGMSGFGASAPADRLYEEFGITAEAVAEKVKSLL